jgi:N-acetylglucosamine-6-phosphate deacetylase
MLLPSKVPSLFDLQANGFGGVDFRDPEVSCEALHAAFLVMREKHHTHRILLTITTNTIDRMQQQFLRIESFATRDSLIAEMIAGYHVEGPYMSPEPGYAGAHNGDLMKAPDLAEFDLLQNAANGKIKLLTLAPEWPGSIEFIAGLKERGVVTSIGHSNASDEVIDESISAGLTLCTHLGNGIPQEMHRHSNVLQLLLSKDELTACFIPDGIHVPPSVLRNFFRAKPEGKSVFISDCISPAGAPPGRYFSNGHELEVGEDRVARRVGQRNFAGSTLALDQGVSNISSWLGLSIEEAWHLCSTAPAALVGVTLPQIEAPQSFPDPFEPPKWLAQGT